MKTINKNNLPTIKNRSLYDVYNRPSQTKVNIYNKWCAYFYDLCGQYDNTKLEVHTYDIGIASYNSNIFTIDCIIYADDEPIEYWHITPTKEIKYIVQ